MTVTQVNSAQIVNRFPFLRDMDGPLRDHATAEITKTLDEYGPAKGMVAGMPKAALSYVLAGSFGNGISQTIQEILNQLIPKAGVNGIIRHSGLVIADEATVEMLEYAALYFFPTLFGIGLAGLTSRALPKLAPHFEMLGRRMYDLEKHAGKTMTVGTLKPKQVHVDKKLLNRVGFAKLFNTVNILMATILAEVVLVSLRPVLTKKLFGTDNFYRVSGIEKDTSHDNDGDNSIKQGWKNVKDGTKLFAILAPAIFGLMFAMSKLGFAKLPIFRKLSRHFDLDNKFGLSRTILALSIIPGAAYGYNTTARNSAEAKENLMRMMFFSWPAILYFKQIFGTFLAYMVGKAHGLGNVIGSPAKTWWKETFGKEKGKRDLLNLNFADIDKKQDDGILSVFRDLGALTRGETKHEYQGAMTELPQLKDLSLAKRKKFFQQAHFAREHAPIYLFALPVGVVVAWWNYLRTKRMHAAERHGEEISMKDYSPPIRFMEHVTDKAAGFFYGIQQKNFGDMTVGTSSVSTIPQSPPPAGLETELALAA